MGILLTSDFPRTPFPAQLSRCHRLLDSGEPRLCLHALGAAIPRALSLALRLQKARGADNLDLDVFTDTVELTDDFEPVRGDAAALSRTRHNSAVHVKLTVTEKALKASSPVSSPANAEGNGHA